MMTQAEKLYNQYELTRDIDSAYYYIRKTTKVPRFARYCGKYSTIKFRFEDESSIYVKCIDGFPYQLIKV